MIVINKNYNDDKSIANDHLSLLIMIKLIARLRK